MTDRRSSSAARLVRTRVLVPLDFSRGAERALERSVRVAVALRCEVHLLHVLAPEGSRVALGRAQRALERARARFEAVMPDRRGVHVQLRRGKPYVEIIHRARELGAEWIILGRNAAAGRFGATLSRIVQMSETPILVVNRRARGAYRHALAAVEIDPSARNLIELVCRIVHGTESQAPRVRIVHAYHAPFVDSRRAIAEGSGAFYAREARQAAAGSLAELLAAVRPHPCSLESVVRNGDPRTVIAREAARYRADLVAVGTHGRSGIAHALLGSVAEWVLAHSRRDVLIARPVRFTFVPP